MDRSVCPVHTVALTNQIRNRCPLSATNTQSQNIPNSTLLSLVPALRCVASEFDLDLVFLVQAEPRAK